MPLDSAPEILSLEDVKADIAELPQHEAMVVAVGPRGDPALVKLAGSERVALACVRPELRDDHEHPWGVGWQARRPFLVGSFGRLARG